MTDDASLDCAIAFAFGFIKTGESIEPGRANEDLAAAVEEQAGPVPKILQFEIADAYALRAPDDQVFRIERNHRRPGAYVDTMTVALQAVDIMAAHGWSSAAIFAHPHHLWRARKVCERLGIRTDDEQIAAMSKAPVRYDGRSAQRWTRAPWLFRPYEIGARAVYRARGQI